VTSDDSADKGKIFSDRLPTSSRKISSRSGQKKSNENGSENRRYGSSYSYQSSVSDSEKDYDDLQEQKLLANMLQQSYVRRSTEFDGKGTPNLTDFQSKKRASSARSRESFFIPSMLNKEAEKNNKETKDKAKAIAVLEVSERLGDKSSNCDNQGDSSRQNSKSNNSKQLEVPNRPRKGNQISMTDIASVVDDTGRSHTNR